MKRTLTCPRCDGGRIWNIRTMHERGLHNLPQEMAVAFDYNRDGKHTPSHGTYETFLCAGCGFTCWYACDFEPGDQANVAGPRTYEVACADCGGAEFWFLARVEERDSHGEPTDLRIVRRSVAELGRGGDAGAFSARVCTGCGLLGWRALGLDEVLAAEVTSRIEDGPLCACGSRARHRVETLREVGDAYLTSLHVQLRAGLLYTKAIGELGIEICADCSNVDWFARGLEGLRHAPHAGVLLLERTVPPEGSPYR